MKKDLIKENAVKKEDVVFIDAQYEDNEEAKESVQELTQKESISKKVVITTPVLDNGVSFHDDDLRKIAIFTDTKEEFIQMLGRKRSGQRPAELDLYICKRNQAYFASRCRDVERTLRYYQRYNAKLPHDSNQAPNVWYQEEALDDLMRNEQTYHQMKKFCYVEGGMLKINVFSRDRLVSNRKFYKKMSLALNEDEDAFLKEQASWLGFSELSGMEMLSVLSNAEKSIVALNAIKETISKYLDKDLSKEENMKMAAELQGNLEVIVTEENGFDEKDIKAILKGVSSDRPISVKNFNAVISQFQDALPYQMEKPTGSTFRISVISNSDSE